APTDSESKPGASTEAVEPIVFEVDGLTDRFPTFAAAVAAAQNGGVIMVHGDGPIPLKPQRLHGKALTIRAAEGMHPRLTLANGADIEPWQALLMTAQPLHLDGLELVCEQTSKSQIGTAHLVYVEKAPLTLTNCSIRAPLGQACVVCRECPK